MLIKRKCKKCRQIGQHTCMASTLMSAQYMSPFEISNDKAAGYDIPVLMIVVWLLPSSCDRTILARGPLTDQYRYLYTGISSCTYNVDS